MKKFIFYLSASFMAVSVAQAQYVRKVVRPNFFIPAKELNRVEKLPPFPEYEDTYEEDINYVIPAKPEQPQKAKQPPTPAKIAKKQGVPEVSPAAEQEPVQLIRWSLYQEEQKNQPIENKPASPEIVPEKPSPKNLDLPTVDERVLPDMTKARVDDNFEQTAEYKQITQEYANDINTLAESGQIPENKNISAALSKMISDDAVWVDENFGK